MRIISVFLMIYVFCAPLALAKKGGAGMRMAQRVLESYIGQRVLFKDGSSTYFSGRIKSVLPPSPYGNEEQDFRIESAKIEIDSLVTQKWVEEPDLDQTMTINASEVAAFQDMDYSKDVFHRRRITSPVEQRTREFGINQLRAIVHVLTMYKTDSPTDKPYFDVLVTNIQRLKSSGGPLEQLLEEPYVVLIKGSPENEVPLHKTLE